MTRTEALICRHRGSSLEGFVEIPDGSGPHPAVVIIHGGDGFGPIVPRTARRLAEAGYLAVAADMVGPEAQKQGHQAVREACAIFGQDPMLACQRTAAWVETAAAHPLAAPERIAAIGYCFGGHCVLDLARSGADVAAVVSFHGILTTSCPATRGAVKAQVAVYTGALDPFVPAEHVETFRKEFSDAGASFHICEFSQAQHSFTDPHAGDVATEGLAYDTIADRVSWDGMMALLDAVLRDDQWRAE